MTREQRRTRGASSGRLDAKGVEALLGIACQKLGFCLSPEERIKLQREPPTNAKDFADAIIVAEGLNPVTIDGHLKRQLRDAVMEAFARWGVGEV